MCCGYSIPTQPCIDLALPGHISSAHRAGKDGARVGMNDTAHQRKNEQTKKDKRKAGEEKK